MARPHAAPIDCVDLFFTRLVESGLDHDHVFWPGGNGDGDQSSFVVSPIGFVANYEMAHKTTSLNRVHRSVELQVPGGIERSENFDVRHISR